MMVQLLECQEINLTQKAHQIWLLNGDRNIKYFHLLLVQKRSRCQIFAIKNNYGYWMTSQEEMKYLALIDVFFGLICINWFTKARN